MKQILGAAKVRFRDAASELGHDAIGAGRLRDDERGMVHVRREIDRCPLPGRRARGTKFQVPPFVLANPNAPPPRPGSDPLDDTILPPRRRRQPREFQQPLEVRLFKLNVVH